MGKKQPVTPEAIFELSGTYRIEFLFPAGIPTATARFQKVGKNIIGEYEEPGRNLQKLTAIYADGDKCGWNATSGENGDEVFNFELNMYAGGILLGGAISESGVRPVMCKKIEDSKIVVNLSDLGVKIGVPQKAAVPGEPLGMNLVWDPSHVAAMVTQVKPFAREGKPIAFTGHVSSWLLVAVSWAVQPCKAILHIPERNISQEMPSLPIGNPNPAGGLTFKITGETEDRIYLEFIVDTSGGVTAHTYDSSRLPNAVLPPIASGKDLFVSGNGPNLIPVAIGLGYGSRAKSISFRYHEDPYFVCSVSNDPTRPVGATELVNPGKSRTLTV